MSTCFIILPLTTPVGGSYKYKKDHFAKVLDNICVPAVELIDFTPIRPDEPGTHKIDEKILAHLRNADLVLCDVSSLNANVLYELGIRSALNKPFAIIKDRPTPNPFDLTNFRYCPYDPETVYKEKAKDDLIEKVAEHLLRTLDLHVSATEEPVKGAAACSITEVFPSRNETEAEVLGAVKNATRRLWILGVGLSQVFTLSENLSTIENKIVLARQSGASFDARILLLDALTSTGVFRTLIECSASKADKIIKAPRSSNYEARDDPYFNQRLYHDFINAWRRFKDQPDIENIVRFHGHAPTCWLIVADDTAYFQPYTFGAAPGSAEDGGLIGPLVPVFKFEDAEFARPFKILEDHFRKLWLTTNTDLFHVRARDPEAGDALYDVFRTRGHWLRQVHSVLHNPGGDQRRYPRKRCKSKLINSVRRDTRQAAEQPGVAVKEVIDFSREGLAFKLEGIKLKKGDRIKVEVKLPSQSKGARGDNRGKKEKAGEYVKKMLVDPYDGKFRVVHTRKEGEFLIVGLQPVEKKPSGRNVLPH